MLSHLVTGSTSFLQLLFTVSKNWVILLYTNYMDKHLTLIRNFMILHRQFLCLCFLFAAYIPLCAQECRHAPPFEKIYVCHEDVLTTHDGIYYKSPSGEQEKVRALRTDCYGTYIIKFKQICPLCERCYSTHAAQEGYSCPLSEKEILPYFWTH